MKQSKPKKKTLHCLNPLNLPIYNKIKQLKVAATMRNKGKIAFCYSKIMMTLARYPLPILTAGQAIDLDGVGEKSAILIDSIVKSHYGLKDVDDAFQVRQYESQLTQKAIP